MTRKQLSKAVAKATGYAQKDTIVVVTSVFEQIAKAMERGETIKIENFGEFKALSRSERRCTSPLKPGEVIIVPACRVAHLTPAPLLKSFLNGEADEFLVRKPMPERGEAKLYEEKDLWELRYGFDI